VPLIATLRNKPSSGETRALPPICVAVAIFALICRGAHIRLFCDVGGTFVYDDIRCAAGRLRQRYQHIYGEISTTVSGPVRCSLLTVRHRRHAYRQSDGGLISMVDAKELPADGRRSTHWTMAEVLAAVGQAGDNAAAIAHTVSNWATLPNFRITGGTGPTYPSFTVRADTGRATGTRPCGVLTLYADSHGSGSALE
jgi:hypothetical protein